MTQKKNKKLSVIIPCYNEKDTILEILKRVESVDLPSLEKEILVIDDGSTDGTSALLLKGNYTIIHHPKNRGKGYSIRTGLKQATGDFILIQDADLEYSPEDYAVLLRPLLEKKAVVVYGSRERNKENKTHSGWCFYLGGLFLTWLTNVLYGARLTDQATCYKVFSREVLENIALQEDRFGFCTEVTVRLLQQNIQPLEVPIQYFPRKKREGKKISWKDGVRAIYLLIKMRMRK